MKKLALVLAALMLVAACTSCTKENAEDVVDDVKENIEETVDEVKEDVEEKVDEIKEDIEEVKEDVEEKVEEIKEDVEEEAGNIAGMVNPMVATDAEGFAKKYTIAIPEGAENVQYFFIANELGNVKFDLNGLSFDVRVKPTAEAEDISGMNYEWTVEDDCKVAHCDGKTMRYIGEEETVDVCTFFDAAPGISYAVSTQAADLDGFDIIAIAEQVYVPMQGEVDGEAAAE